MNEEREQAIRGWAKFLNPEVLRSNLIAASIFLATYEIFKTSVIDRIHDFFNNRAGGMFAMVLEPQHQVIFFKVGQ